MTSHPKLPRTTRNEAVTCGQSKTYQNDCVDTNRLMRVQWQRKRIRDRSLFITWGRGGGGGWGAKTRWNLADPLFEFYFTEVIPPNNVWCLSSSPPPHVFIFQANLSGPPRMLPKFSATPSFWFSAGAHQTGSQFSADPPFCSPSNQVITPKIPSPPAPGDK